MLKVLLLTATTTDLGNRLKGKLKSKKGALNGFDGSNLLEIDDEI